MAYMAKCPKCGYELKEDEIKEKPIGRKTRLVAGVFMWLLIPTIICGLYIKWEVFLVKYDTVSFIINLIMTVVLLFVLVWVGYCLVFDKKLFKQVTN